MHTHSVCASFRQRVCVQIYLFCMLGGLADCVVGVAREGGRAAWSMKSAARVIDKNNNNSTLWLLALFVSADYFAVNVGGRVRCEID
jgi:hypothetical protein